MKEKFLQFFTGKLSKSIYIAVTSAVVCGAVVIGSAVAVHNHNQEIQMENTASESGTETVTDSVTEGVSVTEGNDTTAPTQAANNEPAGDRALQYLAEYNRITEEYEKKSAELSKETILTIGEEIGRAPTEPHSRARRLNESQEEYDAYLKGFQKQYEQYVQESKTYVIAESEAQSKAAEEKARAESASKQLQELKEQYEKDIEALKAQYGIA